MKSIWTFLKKQPIHLILLPSFFILETWLRYKGLLDSKVTIVSYFILQLILITGFLIFNLILRSKLKASIIITVFGFFYLYFGSIKILLQNTTFLIHISHYKVLLPILFFLALYFIYKIIKTSNLSVFNLFLNSLFIIYILIELIKIPFDKNDTIKLAVNNIQPTNEYHSNNKKPNIYYLLFDCYPSTIYQNEVLNINNNFLDSLLTSNGFYVAENAISNYSNTAFSMASTFGMNYIDGIDTVAQMSPILYNKAMQIVKTAPLIPFFKKQGYNFINLSIFDIADKPALKKERFLSITTKQILYYFSFFDCIRRDLFWQLFPALHKKSIRKDKNYLQNLLGPNKKYNKQLIDTLSGNAFVNSNQKPFFLYAHFEMPHFPYFYDASGNPYPENLIYTDSIITDRKKFAGYIEFTNFQIKKIIENIQLKNNGDAVIIIQSDHGINDIVPDRKNDAFSNFSAFYFPDKGYSTLYDGISNVNTFRIILNKYFQQNLPLLKDKSYYIK